MPDEIPPGWTATEYVKGSVYSLKHRRIAMLSTGSWVASVGGHKIEYSTPAAAIAALEKEEGNG